MDIRLGKTAKQVLAGIVAVVVCVTVLCLIFGWISSQAPSNETIVASVEAAGYTNVTVSEPSAFNAALYCSSDDYFYYDVKTATNVRGDAVTNMYVCAGILKGQTIRYK